MGPQIWQDMRTDDTYTTIEVLRLYPEVARFAGFTEPDVVPQPIRDFLDSFSVDLIETQRLLTIEREDPRRRDIRQVPTVIEHSRDLRRRLQHALAQNSRTSQELDRSFPRRLLVTEGLPTQATDHEIRRRYAEQSDLRQRLAEISVLDRSEEIPLPDKELEAWERRVLWTYLDDSEKKLATFENLLQLSSSFRTS